MMHSLIRTVSRRQNNGAVRATLQYSVPLLAVSVLHYHNTAVSATPTRAEGKEEKPTFDITQQWDDAKEYFKTRVLSDQVAEETKETKPSETKNDPGMLGFLRQFAKTLPEPDQKELDETINNLKDVQSSLMGILTGTSNQKTVEDLIAKARTSSEQGDLSDSTSLEELLHILKRSGQEFEGMVRTHLEGRDLPIILPTNLYYFLEHEDERKNFSWRRRKHRFCPGINVDYVTELNSYMRLAELGYVDDLEEIKSELRDIFNYELVYCQMDSLPGQPSHFVAIKKDQSTWSSSLDMIVVVRGTKTITDVVTDLLADAVDYRGGKAHSGICQSGKFLAEKHQESFEEFLQASGKSNLNLTLIGHSLGAGAASIAGMELKDKGHNVQVYGFGCPALLSEDLSEATKDYITTIVSDNDCIPRMSMASMINAMLDIGEYNWLPKANEDLVDVVDQVQIGLPGLISDSVKEKMLGLIRTTVKSTIEIPQPTLDRMSPVLFPPGKCIHFYRDGYGLAGAVVPCTFFDELDVNRRMVDDHLFDTGYRLVFLDLMRQYKQDHYFQFDIKK